MKPTTKKALIIGGLSVISIFLAAAYIQYQRLMNYTIKFKGVRLKTLTPQVVNFDLFINFTNNSDIKFEIVEQDYKVYLNDVFVSQLANKTPTQIAPKGSSVIPINVDFNPTSVGKLLGQNVLTILTSPEKVNLKVDVKLKVSFYGIKLSIPYVYTASIKEMIAASKNPQS